MGTNYIRKNDSELHGAAASLESLEFLRASGMRSKSLRQNAKLRGRPS